MNREEWEYRLQDMKVQTVKLTDNDERKPVLQAMIQTFEKTMALHDELEEYDPDEAQRFVVEMCGVLEKHGVKFK